MLVDVLVLDIELDCLPIADRSTYLSATPHEAAVTAAEVRDAFQPELANSTSDAMAAPAEVVTEELRNM